MAKLLYHRPSGKMQESPFDRAILEIAQGQLVQIVSPYISIRYLNRIISAASSWRLISDVSEWLATTSARDRSEVEHFIAQHESLIHHYPAIHAKVVISPTGAYTGSANLTEAGIQRRTEFGTLLTDPLEISEVQKWFDQVWAMTSSPSTREVQDFLVCLTKRQQAESLNPVPTLTPLQSTAPAVKATLGSVSFVSDVHKAHGNTPFDFDEQLSHFIDHNAHLGFRFAEVHRHLKSQKATLRMRDTYLGVLDHCASQPRSLVWPHALHRLIYINGHFVQSNSELLTQVLAPLDNALAWIFNFFDFTVGREIPDSPHPGASIDIPSRQFKLLLEELCNQGFLLYEEGLKLSTKAEWSSRLLLLKKAHIQWLIRHEEWTVLRQSTNPALVMENGAVQEALERYGASEPIAMSAHKPKRLETEDTEVSKFPLTFETKAYKKRIERNIDKVFSLVAKACAKDRLIHQHEVSALVRRIVSSTELTADEVRKLITGKNKSHSIPLIIFRESWQQSAKIYPLFPGVDKLGRFKETKVVIEGSTELAVLLLRARSYKSPRIWGRFEDLDASNMYFVNLYDEMVAKVVAAILEKIESSKLYMTIPELIQGVGELVDLSFDASYRLFYREDGENHKILKIVGSPTKWRVALNPLALDKFPQTRSFVEQRIKPTTIQHSWFAELLA